MAEHDPESLRWHLELAIRNENFSEADRLRKLIAEVEGDRPEMALTNLVRERTRQAVEAGLDRSTPFPERMDAVRQLQDLATPPAAFQEAEDGLHKILRHGDLDEISEAAEAALWSSWLVEPSGDEAVDDAMRQGLGALGAGELDKAVQAFTQVVEGSPDFAEGWNKRATSLFLSERFDESIADCARVLALKPKHFGCLSGLGICYLRKGDEQEAIRYLRKALEVNPRSGDMQRIVSDLEARSAFAVMKPQIKQAIGKLKSSDEPATSSRHEAMTDEVQTGWEAYRVRDGEKCTYFFRVWVRCLEGEEVTGTARYYALKHAGGDVFPLSRMTQGPSSFSLRPGESYCYSFILTLKEGQELIKAQGGLLLRRGEDELFEAGLGQIELQTAPKISEADIPEVTDGYPFMGRLEISVDE